LAKIFFFLKAIIDQAKTSLLGELQEYIEDHVARLNKSIDVRPSFAILLKRIVTKEPISYWDMIEVENPRAGKRTVRRSTRRRKTPEGLLPDGAKL
jgi:hypothetical protein